jgi:hypothetical protein
MKNKNLKYLALLITLVAGMPLLHAQDKSLKPSKEEAASKVDKKERAKEAKALDRMHRKDENKATTEFSKKKQYKKVENVKPIQPNKL